MSHEDNGVANLLGMARTATAGGNQQEALTYYNRVLEIDPTISEAWLGKGKAAGWQSSLANLRLPEALIAFNHAIATATEGARPSITNEVVGEVNRMVVALYRVAREHMMEYASLDNTWESYLVQVSQMIDALDNVRAWSPSDRTTLENIVHLCKDNIEGYSFRNKFNNNMPMALGISETYERLLRERMNQAAAAIRSMDGSYSPPSIEKKQAEACFVVTATMGDPQHPQVLLLRRFRDEWILKRRWGKAFVDFYSKVGPPLAAVIEGSKLLRRLSFILIVKPAARFAHSRLRRLKL
ncbi:hypothetical protein EN828_25255 [Mesorhizobium sp. M2D.F.Ca.ET.185.01.1.1]|uniref:CFI-box-CTERM domain-containing protein n=1 Tax=unclassified Mesorhizobium TaxID=325217 RepID=UPI000FCB1467|nr:MULTISPECIES: CFI-box-CTERM domain-containing protein [unclassified Mesorhizobium]TGP74360.1 hypothetical protein EN870_27075 [bacterium M00.F.Ca.ET.227.01.1.1]TGP85046.1 hypothetical protein EN864_27180 [bacterium M00.F.Ca.ET.221.01.1.1]TGP89129.1 hypothetical protein EN865_25605 [bacterium M00.F.Ca.ET.222.01.1.1]TGU12813.1 hypothetical protein EN806_15660 [bacterium M00.F.Ca.ET.163.01.1.1]TGU21284.1 hypothetical protein EN799_53940 [bacterium M00.F.Ca.ET.156.01.1.1]TGU43681.1 hypothetica